MEVDCALKSFDFIFRFSYRFPKMQTKLKKINKCGLLSAIEYY